MGGKSSSSSSSSQTTQTQNVSLSDIDGAAIAGIDNATVTVTDAGATAQALELGQTAIDGGVDIVTGLFNYLDNAQETAVSAVSDTAKLATAALAESRPVNSTAETNGLYLVLGSAAAAWAAVNIYREKRK